MNDNDKTKAQLIQELNDLRAESDVKNASGTNRIANLIDYSGDAIYVIELATGRFVDVNSKASSDLGYSREELLTMGVMDIEKTMPDDFCWKRHLDQVSQMPIRIFNGEHRRKDGTVFPVEVSTKITDEREGFMVSVARDITDRKLAEEEKAAYTEFMDSVPGFGFAKDINLTYVTANRTFCDLLKVPYDQIKGKTDYDIFPADLAQKYIADDKRVIETGKPILVEEVTINANTKQRFVVASRKHPWFDKKGNVIGVYGMGFDITEMKESEQRESDLREKLSRSERMESLGVLAGGVAHDLNNVLGPLVVLPDLISEDLADLEQLNIEETQESLDIIRLSAKRAGAIVKDLVSLSRRGNYDLIHMDISQVQCISPYGKCKVINQQKTTNPNVTFINEPNEEPLIILGDESHLSRVVSNLIQNASESIAKKGIVTIKTSKKILETPLAGYETVPKGDYAVIEISDEGEGIGKEHLDRIFEPFYTRKKKSDVSGSGLGLSVVNGIIKDHAGFIDVKSEVGKGSVFTVYLPLVAKPKDDKEPSVAPAVVGGTERVLIVDDEPGQLFIGRKSLQRQGYDVAVAEDGHQALEYFEKAKKTGEESPYHLIVLDMIMEEGFDGLDTYEAILKLYPKQKALVVSGHAEDGRTRAAGNLGADWLDKPYELDDLARAVRKRLDRQ